MSLSDGSSCLSSPELDEDLNSLPGPQEDETSEVLNLPHTTQRLKDINLKEISEERADDKILSEATSLVPSLSDVLKQVLAKKEIAQIACLKALL
ncbi:hypothetical protein [Parasitella parasitica]|uniref:Uncharacterized protein n=1 Tax=Parasitella parasitica TaxID=35722 RepID=A0A0B7N2X7_9FUNG|nr:hypothetical protein [Parasitella parasitica]